MRKTVAKKGSRKMRKTHKKGGTKTRHSKNPPIEEPLEEYYSKLFRLYYDKATNNSSNSSFKRKIDSDIHVVFEYDNFYPQNIKNGFVSVPTRSFELFTRLGNKKEFNEYYGNKFSGILFNETVEKFLDPLLLDEVKENKPHNYIFFVRNENGTLEKKEFKGTKFNKNDFKKFKLLHFEEGTVVGKVIVFKEIRDDLIYNIYESSKTDISGVNPEFEFRNSLDSNNSNGTRSSKSSKKIQKKIPNINLPNIKLPNINLPNINLLSSNEIKIDNQGKCPSNTIPRDLKLSVINPDNCQI
jgi:hypothetical protein